MIGAATYGQAASQAPMPRGVVTGRVVSPARTAYRALTGCDSAEAQIDSDRAFDRHVLASILAVAATEPGSIVDRCGLGANDFATLMTGFFPHISVLFSVLATGEPAEDDEVTMLRDLLLAHRSTHGEVSRWLAALVARRAMEPNHLWEDLGLRDRSELTRLLMRHFAPLAQDNTRNMRWKRFFYRKLCEDDGMVMCSTPVCSHCNDFNECFGDESGESRMADRRRQAELQASSIVS